MGNINTNMPLPRYGFCIRPSNPNAITENPSQRFHNGKTKEHYSERKEHRRNLSAAFNISELDSSCVASDQPDFVEQSSLEDDLGDLININTATEEVLMTLRGINRIIAQNIVEYRRAIGGFRKIEDLALVSGVGAIKLNNIRLEICVGRRFAGSKNSSTSSSGIDLSIADNTSHVSTAASTSKRITQIDINSSNVFQLMKVKLINQQLAENIVMYRDSKGPYTSINQLLKVKGIKQPLLTLLEPYLKIEEPLSSFPKSFSFDNTISKRNSIPSDYAQKRILNHCGILANRILRKPSKSMFFQLSEFRLASWNLVACGREKATNPGVREVIANVIAENNLSIMAVQDIMDSIALDMICSELNHPAGNNLLKKLGRKTKWKHVLSSVEYQVEPQEQNIYQGFIYDKEQGVELLGTENIKSHNFTFCSLFLGRFKIKNENVSIINIQITNNTKYDKNDISEMMNVLTNFLHSENNGNQQVIITGFFATSSLITEIYEELKTEDFLMVSSMSSPTDISFLNKSGSDCSSTYFINNQFNQLYTGNCGVIRKNLSNPLIPNGWSWNGYVSPFCPTWVEFRHSETTLPLTS